MEGTASTVRAFLLVEAPGPWGVTAVRDSRLPQPVKRWLSDLAAAHRVRPLLIRRPAASGRASASPSTALTAVSVNPTPGTAATTIAATAATAPREARVFAVSTHGAESWVETATLRDVHELLDLDLSGLAEGKSPGLTPHDEPLFLVCTHGRHDACCAERGRPLAAALSEAAPDHTWEVSHIGGDRYAANLLVLPHGLYYGRLAPQDAAGFVESHLAGQLDLDHLRGRSSYPFAVQAAEIYLRRHQGRTEIGPPLLEGHSRSGTQTEAIFTLEGRRWKVVVQTDAGEPRQLTCRATVPSSGFSHRLIGIAEA